MRIKEVLEKNGLTIEFLGNNTAQTTIQKGSKIEKLVIKIFKKQKRRMTKKRVSLLLEVLVPLMIEELQKETVEFT